MQRTRLILHSVRTFLMRIVFPLIILFYLGSVVATGFDKNHYKNAPASDFLRYTQVSVNNALEGENVYFRVCREFNKRYNYDGKLTIYIVPNPDNLKGKPIPVYARDISGSLNSDRCEDKVIRNKDFAHTAGNYKMNFYVCFKVKYGFEKCSEGESGIYTVRRLPEDTRELIQYYQNIINNLQTDGSVNSSAPSSLTVPNSKIQSSSTPASNTPSTGSSTPATPKPGVVQRVLTDTITGVENVINDTSGLLIRP